MRVNAVHRNATIAYTECRISDALEVNVCFFVLMNNFIYTLIRLYF